MIKISCPLDADADRRAFLGTAAGVLVPPAMVMLLSTSLSSPAIAASGGAVPGAGGGGSHSRTPIGPLLGVGAVGAAATQASGPAAQLAAGTAPPAVPASTVGPLSSSSAGSALAPVATHFAENTRRAPQAIAAGAVRPTPTSIGGDRRPDRRAMAVRRAGERG